MMIPLGSHLRRCLSVAFLLALCFHSGGCVECYICSYSPYNNSLIVDRCTDDNFTAEYIHSNNCDDGCESVTTYDANHVLTTFYRNCAPSSSSVHNECYSSPTTTGSHYVCTCDWDYCNSAVRSFDSLWLPLLLIIGTSWLPANGMCQGWFMMSGS